MTKILILLSLVFSFNSLAQTRGDARFEVLKSLYMANVFPQIELAEQSKEGLFSAYDAFKGWEGQLGPYAALFAADVENSYQKLGDASLNVILLAKQNCNSRRDVEQFLVIKEVYDWANRHPQVHARALFFDAKAYEYVEKCVRFKLEMQSRIEYEGHDGTIIAQVASTVDIKLKNPLDHIGNELELIGDGMSDYVSLDWPIPPNDDCTLNETLFDAPAAVSSMKLRMDTSMGSGDRDIDIRFSPGMVYEVMTMTCRGMTFPVPIERYYLGQWGLLHQDEDFANNSISILEWQPSGAGVYAQKFYDHSAENGAYESASFKLVHDPID